jgi:hypothetical protein
MHNNNQTFLPSAPAQDSIHRAPSVQVHGGGVVRVQHGAVQASEPQQPREMSRVHTGPIKLSMGPGGEVRDAGVTRHVHTDTGHSGGSIMGTLRTGANPSVLLIPGDESSRTSLVVAEREGLIRRNAAGHYEDVAVAAVAEAARQGLQPGAAEQPTEDPSAGAIDAEEEALWAQDIEPLSQPGFDRATASAVGLIAHGTGSVEDIADNLARSEGIDPALANEYVSEGIAMGQRIVDRALAPLGLTGDRLAQFYEAVKQQPAKLQDALQRVAHARDVGGFTALAAEWKAQTADLSVWKAHGFQAAVDPQTGDVLVQRGTGPWVKASALK